MNANLKRGATFVVGCALFIGSIAKAVSEMKMAFDYKIHFQEVHVEATVFVVAIAFLLGVASMLHSFVGQYKD